MEPRRWARRGTRCGGSWEPGLYAGRRMWDRPAVASTRRLSRRSSAALALLTSAVLVGAPAAGAVASPPSVQLSSAVDAEDARPVGGLAVLGVALLGSAVAAGVASRRRDDVRR